MKVLAIVPNIYDTSPSQRFRLEQWEPILREKSAKTETQDLSRYHIGMMPLPAEPWHKGKCALKALQYMALEIPTICSPVGVNSKIIQDGKNGFLATTDDEWIVKLKRLLKSEEMRRKIDKAGRTMVEEKYLAEVQAPPVYEIFASILDKQKNFRLNT